MPIGYTRCLRSSLFKVAYTGGGMASFFYRFETLKNNKMIKPEIDLELSINALKVYGIEPNIIKSMLSNLQKVVNRNCTIPPVIKSACENCGKYEAVICQYCYDVESQLREFY